MCTSLRANLTPNSLIDFTWFQVRTQISHIRHVRVWEGTRTTASRSWPDPVEYGGTDGSVEIIPDFKQLLSASLWQEGH